MCGIVAYIGPKNGVPILIQGLRRLEYRGYDSAGLAVLNNQRVECLKRKGKIIDLESALQNKVIEGNLGIGHCLHPKTVVQLSNGQTTYIKDIVNGFEVINLDPVKMILNCGPVRMFKHESPRYLFRVRTPISDFVATENHKTLIYSKGIITEKAITELKRGDLLPIPRQIIIKETAPIRFKSIFYKRYYSLTATGLRFLRRQIKLHNRQAITMKTGISSAYLNHILANDRNFREDKIKLLYQFFGKNFNDVLANHFKPVNTIHGKFLHLPEISSAPLMQFLGYFIGDGYAGQKSLRFKDLDVETLKVYQRIIKKEFGINGRITKMKKTVAKLLEYNSYYFCQWLKTNINKNYDEFIGRIGQLPEDQLAAFIRGLFDAEGCVDDTAKQLSISMNNEFLVRSLQLWLLRFGIVSSFSIMAADKKQKRPNQSFKLSISNKQSLERFYEKIGFGSKNKMIKLKYLLQSVGNKIFSFKVFPEYKNLIFSRVTEINKIKSDVNYVYDLEVDNNHNFLANTIFTHNSRWATHGEPNEVNAHPHFDCQKKVFVVHNGIIENYNSLRDWLIKQGHQFRSETDTEVIAHLIENYYQGDLLSAVQRALNLVEGTYGLAIISADESDKLIAARRGSPLIIGIVNDGEYIVASDPAAVVEYTRKVIYLADGEIAILKRDGYQITTLDNFEVKKEAEEILWDLAQIEKGGFPHFMLKEIFEQPETIKNAMRGRVLLDAGRIQLGGIKDWIDFLTRAKRIVIMACGTSWHAGLIGEYLFEQLAGIPTEVEYASEFRYKQTPIDNKETAYFVISQSGETADTLESLRKVKKAGGKVFGIVNVVGSTIARETEAGIYLHAGPEIGVASTKAFTSQVTVLIELALLLGIKKGIINQEEAKRRISALIEIPDKIEKILEQKEEIKKIAKKYFQFNNFLYLGRGYNFPTALEGALKLKEISYIHAEGYPAAEMKHGPIALIDKNMPTVVIATDTEDIIYQKVISNIEEVKARGGSVIAIATEGNQQIKEIADEVIYVPKTNGILTPLLNIIPLQLLAYYMAVLRGCDVDKPRNLAKSVTVE